MAQNIKPPSAKSVDGIANQGQAGQAAKTGGAAFKEALNRAAQPSAAAGAQQVQEVKGAQKIAADLKAGKIDSARAVELLINERMQSPAAASLTPAGKAALEAHLRSRVTTDPSIMALVAELEGSEQR